MSHEELSMGSEPVLRDISTSESGITDGPAAAMDDPRYKEFPDGRRMWFPPGRSTRLMTLSNHWFKAEIDDADEAD